jgi:hypothetical protein
MKIEETAKQKLLNFFIIVMLVILAVEVKMIYDRHHPPTTAPAGMVMVYEGETTFPPLIGIY